MYHNRFNALSLTGKRARERGLLNQREVLALLDEHRRNRRDNARHLWGLLTLELWHRAFIDQQPALKFSGAKKVRLDRLALATGRMTAGCQVRV